MDSPARPAILVVDDDVEALHMIRRMLALVVDFQQYDLVLTQAPHKVVHHMRTRLIALLIIDYHLGSITGLHVTDMLKAVSPTTQTILITAYADATVARLARQHQIDSYLPKPFTLRAFEPLCQQALAAWTAARP